MESAEKCKSKRMPNSVTNATRLSATSRLVFLKDRGMENQFVSQVIVRCQ